MITSCTNARGVSKFLAFSASSVGVNSRIRRVMRSPPTLSLSSEGVPLAMTTPRSIIAT